MISTDYYKDDYTFELNKIAGGWYARNVSQQKAKVIDKALAAKIGEMIDVKIRV